MKMTRLALIGLSFLTFFLNVGAENPCGVMIPQNTGEWGQGIIWIPKAIEVNLRNSDGEVIGSIYRESKYGRMKLRLDGFDVKRGYHNDFVAAGHTSVALIKVYKTDGQRYKLFKQFDDNGVWVNKEDIDAALGEFLTYEQMLFNERNALPEEIQWLLEMGSIGVNLTEVCLNLRTEPNIQSDKIRCVSENSWSTDFHTHFLVKDYRNGWALVESTQYGYAPELDDSGEGCAFKEIRKETGWVKAIDDNGYPNIWYSVTAY
jgi:hypothetical protein